MIFYFFIYSNDYLDINNLLLSTYLINISHLSISLSIYAEYTTHKMNVNKMDISFPTQLYIDGEFRNSSNGKTITSINPHDQSVICKVRFWFDYVPNKFRISYQMGLEENQHIALKNELIV